MVTTPEFFQVYHTGPLTVLGLGGEDVLDRMNLAEFRDRLFELIQEQKCHTLAFDLTGVKLLPSGLLGLLASLPQNGVRVYLFNPSDDIREVLEITKLDRILQVHSVDVPA